MVGKLGFSYIGLKYVCMQLKINESYWVLNGKLDLKCFEYKIYAIGGFNCVL